MDGRAGVDIAPAHGVDNIAMAISLAAARRGRQRNGHGDVVHAVRRRDINTGATVHRLSENTSLLPRVTSLRRVQQTSWQSVPPWSCRVWVSLSRSPRITNLYQ